MSSRRAIGPVDTIWLNMDRPNNLMVIDGVVLFDEPVDWDRLLAVVRERLISRFPVFGQRQVVPRTPFGLPHWEDDPEFAIEWHIRRATLPAPGGEPELQHYIERQVSRPLDRRHPLWEVHFIDGYGRGAAMLIRFHHALADGIALAQVLLSMTNATPDGDLAPAAEPATAAAALRSALPLVRLAGTAASSAMSAASYVVSELPRLMRPRHVRGLLVQTWRTVGIANKLLLSHNPPTTLDGDPGVAKRTVWSRPIPLDDVKHIGRLAGATVNDVLMSSVAGAISTYLVDRGEVPTDLTTMVPVNVRPIDLPLPSELGNQFALVMLRLPSSMTKPLARLAETKRRMDQIKHSPEAIITFGLITAIGRTAKEVERVLVNFFADKAIGVTTNVAGPTSPRYLAGAKIAGVLAWVPSSGRQTVGVCIFTYNDTVRVGFKVDARTVPEPEKLVHAFDQEVDLLARMAQVV